VDSETLLPFLGGASTPMGQTLDSSVDERGRILAALEEVGGNKSRLAKMLGVSRKTLYARIKKLNISLG